MNDIGKVDWYAVAQKYGWADGQDIWAGIRDYIREGGSVIWDGKTVKTLVEFDELIGWKAGDEKMDGTVTTDRDMLEALGVN